MEIEGERACQLAVHVCTYMTLALIKELVGSEAGDVGVGGDESDGDGDGVDAGAGVVAAGGGVGAGDEPPKKKRKVVVHPPDFQRLNNNLHHHKLVYNPPTDKQSKPSSNCQCCTVANKEGKYTHRRTSTYMCQGCNITLCPVSCFHIYHSYKNYKREVRRVIDSQ